MRGMRKGRDKDNNDYRNHFGGGGGYKKCRSVYLISTAICFME